MNSASGIFGIHSLQIYHSVKDARIWARNTFTENVLCLFGFNIEQCMFVFDGSLDVNFPLKYELTSLTNSPSPPGQCTLAWHKRQLMLYSLSEGNSAPAALAAASGSGYNYLACLNLTPASVKTYFSVSPLLRHPMGCSVTLSRY